MKKLLIIAFMLITLATSAQIKFEAGIAGSLDIGKYNHYYALISDQIKQSVIVNPAVLAGVNINNKVSIHIGFQHIRKGETYKPEALIFSNLNGQTTDNIRIWRRYFFYSIPFNISYNFMNTDSKFSVGIMALADFSMYAARTTYVSPPQMVNGVNIGKTTTDYSNSDSSFFNHYSASVGVGVFIGYNITSHFIANFSPYYKTDLVSLYMKEAGDPRPYYHSFGAILSVFYRL